VPLTAIPASLRHYAATLPQFCLMLPRPSLMWLVGEGDVGPRTILACLGPLARFLPPGAGRTLGAFLASEVEGWKSLAAHEAAFAGRQGRTRLTAFGRRWQLTVTPIFGTTATWRRSWGPRFWSPRTRRRCGRSTPPCATAGG
jgi:hypothetical protein